MSNGAGVQDPDVFVNLPNRASFMVDRPQAISKLREWQERVAHDPSRFIMVIGPNQCGKTQLGYYLQRLRPHMFWVDSRLDATALVGALAAYAEGRRVLVTVTPAVATQSATAWRGLAELDGVSVHRVSPIESPLAFDRGLPDDEYLARIQGCWMPPTMEGDDE